MNIPAFPVEMIYTQENEKFNGMALRDYFAAKAMPVALKTLMHDYTRDDDNWYGQHAIDNKMLAELSYEMADAMMKARQE